MANTVTGYPQAGGGFYRLSDAGFLRLHGADRRAFLQRQSTNQINLLRPDLSLMTVLTSPTARILDVLILLDAGDTLEVITLPGRGPATARYFKSRIFFNDKVSVDEAGGDFVQFNVSGPAAESVLQTLGIPAPAEANGLSRAPDGSRLIRLDAAFGIGLRWLVPVASAGEVEAKLSEAGQVLLSDEEYQTLRVESGLPGETGELIEDFTPLEVGLRSAVSDSKGCYTGQEVIARQITYDKVTRLLSGLLLSAPARPGAELFAEDDSPAGRLTSVAHSSRFGEIGLGIVKRPYASLGSRLHLDSPGGVAEAQVVGLSAWSRTSQP